DLAASATTAVTAINSLRISTAQTSTLTLGATGSVFAVNSGGVLVTAAAGSQPTVIRGANLTVAPGSDLTIITNNTGTTVIGNVIGDVTNNGFGLNKSGPGTLFLQRLQNANTNTGSSTFTGPVTIDGATLAIVGLGFSSN